jgi:hypothetical protein
MAFAQYQPGRLSVGETIESGLAAVPPVIVERPVRRLDDQRVVDEGRVRRA